MESPPPQNFNTKNPRDKWSTGPKTWIHRFIDFLDTPCLINVPGVQPCELTKWGRGKSIWNLYEGKPLASFFVNLHWIHCVFYQCLWPLLPYLNNSQHLFFRLLKMFFFITCHMSSETNGVFTVNWTHLLSGFGQLCDSPGRHHQLWWAKTSEDFWLANFSKKKSLRNSWKNWAKFFFVTIVLFDCWCFEIQDPASCE